MGLDMYLGKFPRYKNATANDVFEIESYLDWKMDKENPKSRARKCTLKKWCGVDYKSINKSYLKYYSSVAKKTYCEWDEEKEHPYICAHTKLVYWRKANEIHNWFVSNVQDGIDDCGVYEVSKEQLEELLTVCKTVRDKAIMENGNVQVGMRFENGNAETIYEDGAYITNAEEISEILPTTSGFFFGSTDYDNYYMDDVNYTIEEIEKVLEETNFDEESVYYYASW